MGRPTASILKELNFPQLNFWRVHSNHARQSRRSSLSKKSFCSHFAFVPDVNSTNKPNTNTFATTNDFTTVATKEESLYASSHSTFCFGNNTVDDQAVLHRLFRGHSSGLRIYCNHNTWWWQSFKVSWPKFDYICRAVGPVIRRQDTHLREAIPVETRATVGLWRLVTGDSYRSCGLMFGIAKSTAIAQFLYTSSWETGTKFHSPMRGSGE